MKDIKRYESIDEGVKEGNESKATKIKKEEEKKKDRNKFRKNREKVTS